MTNLDSRIRAAAERCMMQVLDSGIGLAADALAAWPPFREAIEALEWYAMNSRDAQDSAPAPAVSDTAWLVERGQREGQDPPLWVNTLGEWTRDAWKAQRFRTRCDAEDYIGSRIGIRGMDGKPLHGHDFAAHAVEHGFMRLDGDTQSAKETKQ